jgi:hypothetical protein
MFLAMLSEAFGSLAFERESRLDCSSIESLGNRTCTVTQSLIPDFWSPLVFRSSDSFPQSICNFRNDRELSKAKCNNLQLTSTGNPIGMDILDMLESHRLESGIPRWNLWESRKQPRTFLPLLVGLVGEIFACYLLTGPHNLYLQICGFLW